MHWPTQEDGVLDIILASKEEVVEDVRAGSSPDCRDHEMVELTFLSRAQGKSRSQPQT